MILTRFMLFAMDRALESSAYAAYSWRMHNALLPGDFVRLPARPDWGLGQVQSVDQDRVTVNFEHGGKQLVRIDHAPLEPVTLAP